MSRRKTKGQGQSVPEQVAKKKIEIEFVFPGVGDEKNDETTATSTDTTAKTGGTRARGPLKFRF